MPETAILAPFNVLLIAFLCYAFSGCTQLSESDNQQIQRELSDSLLTTTESLEVELEIVEDGLLSLRLKGSKTSSINHETRNITKISGPVFIEIFDESGRLNTSVESDSAVHYPERSVFELYGNVFVETADNKTLRSNYLQWERNIDRVSTPGYVLIITPTDSINAKGFSGNTDLTNYNLKEVTGEIIVD